jgi:hypothetical protein
MAQGFGGDETIIGLSTAEAVRAVLALSGVLQGYVDELHDVQNVQVKFNEDGEAAVIAVRALDQAQRALNVTLAAGEKEWKLVAAGAAEATSKYRDLAAAARSVREGAIANRVGARDEATRAAITQALGKALEGPEAHRAYDLEMRKFERAIRGVANEAVRAGYTVQEVDDVFRRRTAGSTEFTAAEQKIVAGFRAAQQAASEFGTTADQAANRLARAEAQRLRNVQLVQAQVFKAREQQRLADEAAALVEQRWGAGEAVRGAVTGAFGADLIRASAAEADRFHKAINDVVLEFVRGNVGVEQFGATLTRVTAGSREFGAEEAGLAARLQAVADAQARFGTEASAAVAKVRAELAAEAAAVDRVSAALAREEAAAWAVLRAQGEAARRAFQGNQAREQLRGLYPDTSGGNATERELAALGAAIDRVARDLAAGRVAWADYAAALAKVQAGVRDFTLAEGRIAQSLARIRDAQAGLGQTAAEGAARAARELQRVAAGAERTASREVKANQAVARAALDAAVALRRRNDAMEARTLLAPLRTGPAAGDASMRELKAADDALNRITRDVASGRTQVEALKSAFAQLAAGINSGFTPAEEGAASRLRQFLLAVNRFGQDHSRVLRQAVAEQQRLEQQAARNDAALQREADAAARMAAKTLAAFQKLNAAGANRAAATAARAEANAAFAPQITRANSGQLLA